jgi:hypothetical protein
MENVGVIVIHGVGETREGWIDQYLIPDLQTWTAYRSIGRTPNKTSDRDMVLVVATSDHVQLAIALDTDEHCARFFALTGNEASLTKPLFATPAARKRNRDDFLAIVMSITSAQPAEHWLRALPEAGVPITRAFDVTSTVHRVRDPESSDPTRTWQAFQRVWPLPGRNVRVTELYWADMSNIGSTIFTRLAALFELANEAPAYLGRALLADSTGDIHGLVRRLLVAANWLIRWPIIGFHNAIFLAAFAAMALAPTGLWLAPFIAATLMVIGLGGLLFCRQQLHRRPGLADMALSTAIHALLLLGLIGVAAVATTNLLPTTPEPYLVMSILVLLIAWTAWTVPILLAITLLALIGLKRLVLRRRAASPPLVRPGAALGLNLILAMLLKFLFAALGLLVITILVGAVPAGCPTPLPSSSGFWANTEAYATSNAPCQLVLLKRLLLEVSAFNAMALALLFCVILMVGLVRRGLLAAFPKTATAGTLRLPRLIAHPAILIGLAVGAVVNTALVYVPGLANLQLPSMVLGALRETGAEHLGATALIALVFGLAVLVETSRSALHIGRDLVDHQYDRSDGSWAVRLSKASKPARATDAEPKRFRRRLRIQRRLEALMTDVITHQGCDRLIFLAHSQGTVILRDYLFDTDQLLDDRSAQTDVLTHLKRIDVVTLGSPLTHLYGHYFSERPRHADPTGTARRPIDAVHTWTNLFRIDDPIADAVDVAAPSGVSNRGLPPGGHIGYWGEPPVCELIWGLIDGREASHAASPHQPVAARAV